MSAFSDIVQAMRVIKKVRCVGREYFIGILSESAVEFLERPLPPRDNFYVERWRSRWKRRYGFDPYDHDESCTDLSCLSWERHQLRYTIKGGMDGTII